MCYQRKKEAGTVEVVGNALLERLLCENSESSKDVAVDDDALLSLFPNQPKETYEGMLLGDNLCTQQKSNAKAVIEEYSIGMSSPIAWISGLDRTSTHAA